MKNRETFQPHTLPSAHFFEVEPQNELGMAPGIYYSTQLTREEWNSNPVSRAFKIAEATLLAQQGKLQKEQYAVSVCRSSENHIYLRLEVKTR